MINKIFNFNAILVKKLLARPEASMMACAMVSAGFMAYGVNSGVADMCSVRESVLIDDGWNFSLQPDSGACVGPVSKIVDLPHDWSIEFPFDRNAPAGNDGGYLPTGKAVYSKTLHLDVADGKERKYAIMFEGVYERWTLKVNGDSVGFRPYGYSSVIYDITPYVKDGDNEIEVTVDNSNQKNCRWYSGSGIYRHVRLISTSSLSVEPWSVFVTTPVVASDRGEVDVLFAVGGYRQGDKVQAVLTILNDAGEPVATKRVDVVGKNVEAGLEVIDPELWSPDSPNLYTLNLQLVKDGKTVDCADQTFGIRTIELSASEGMKLNGVPIVLNGACVHHDNGILGAASYDAAEARKVRLLKEAGFNAVRTSHNPPSPSFLDECDRQGLLVIDEAFDGWRDSKNENDYSLFFDEWALTDVGDMVRRDRNHPSIMAWSIGNEVIERKKIEIVTTARKLAKECKMLDPTRPVTQALCAWDNDWEIYDPLAEELDVVGYNYMIHKSESDHARSPERIMWQTESYPADASLNWHKVAENPYIIGDFVWTGIDYLGESGIGRFYYKGETEGEHFHRAQWPWHGAYCGDIDITGLRKPISHYRDMLYNDDNKIYMAVREPDGYNGEVKTTMWGVWPAWESWNWRGHEGKEIDVEVISRYPRVRLYINGEVADEKNVGKADDLKVIFTVPYTPGEIKAVGLGNNGEEQESYTLKTAGAPYMLRLTPDKVNLKSDNGDISFVVAEIVDKEGNVVPDSDLEVSFDVSGPASVIASGSANLASPNRYDSRETKTWKGRAIVAVKSTHKPGPIKLTAKAKGLRARSVKLNSK